MSELLSIAQSSPPAGGAATGQVALLAGFAIVAWGGLVLLGDRQRRGHRTIIGWGADLAERVSGLPGWMALPLVIGLPALAGVYAGFIWDCSIHIDQGRDDGPFANPSHYFLLLGLYGIFATGYLAMVLAPQDSPPRSAVRLTRNWTVPLGGLVVTVAGIFAFAGFPMDDVWHRIYGQDVTLWGPTHLIMLGGAILSLIGFALLVEDGARARRHDSGEGAGFLPLADGWRDDGLGGLLSAAREFQAPPWLGTVLARAARVGIAGAMVVGFGAFLTEFDFGVPQFSLVFQPLVIAITAGVALVSARIWAGPGAAIGAVAIYLAARAIVAVLVGPVLGETTPAMPLFVVEALAVEALASLIGRRNPLALGAAAGVAIGTLGFASEWVWSGLVMPIHWTEALLPEGLIVAVLGGVAGGVLGGLLGSGLRGELPRPRLAGGVAVASMLLIAVLVGNGLVQSEPSGVRASVTLTNTSPPPNREAVATVRFEPRDVAEGASWVRSIAWQGGGLEGGQMERVREGVYRTPDPIPVHGEWKSAIRVMNGRTMLGVPIYAPYDPAIPARAIPAPAHFERTMGSDRELLLRELKDVPSWGWTAGSLLVLLLYIPYLLFLAWSVRRFASLGGRRPQEPTRPPRQAAIATSTPAGVHR